MVAEAIKTTFCLSDKILREELLAWRCGLLTQHSKAQFEVSIGFETCPVEECNHGWKIWNLTYRYDAWLMLDEWTTHLEWHGTDTLGKKYPTIHYLIATRNSLQPRFLLIFGRWEAKNHPISFLYLKITKKKPPYHAIPQILLCSVYFVPIA